MSRNKLKNMHCNLNDLLLKHNCIYNKVIRLKSGINSGIYYDLKKAAGIPEILNHVVEELVKLIPENSNIASVATGAIPYGSVVAYLTQSNFAYVRTSSKNHGTNRLLEGKLIRNKPVYLIEDVCTTGSSIRSAESILLNHGYNNIIKICILNRSKNKINDVISIEDIYAE